MANIIRIRNLEQELDLKNVIIPVDKINDFAYTSSCKKINILDLKTYILSKYDGTETYTSIYSTAPYWTAGGIVAGDSRFPSGFTDIPVSDMFDWMLYPLTTTTTTVPTTTTTTTYCFCLSPILDSITLSATSIFTYTFSNDVGCVAMTYQYTRDPFGLWNYNTNDCSSPKNIDTYDDTGTWYFRLLKNCSICNSIPSNIISYTYTTTTTTAAPTTTTTASPTTTTTTAAPTTTTTTTVVLTNVYLNLVSASGIVLSGITINGTEISGVTFPVQTGSLTGTTIYSGVQVSMEIYIDDVTSSNQSITVIDSVTTYCQNIPNAFSGVTNWTVYVDQPIYINTVETLCANSYSVYNYTPSDPILFTYWDKYGVINNVSIDYNTGITECMSTYTPDANLTITNLGSC